MALSFPSSPANGNSYTHSGKTWVWSAALNVWSLTPTIIPVATPVKTVLTGNGTAATFNILGADTMTNASALIVGVDGVLQVPVTDYSVFNGVITFAQPLYAGAVAVVVSPNAPSVITNYIVTPASARLHSYDNVTGYDYCGKAPTGSLTSAAVWTITRLSISNAGVTTTAVLVNAIWDNRTTIF